MRVDTKSLKEQYFVAAGSQELKPLATQKLKGQAATSCAISLRNSLILGILSNSNTNAPIPKTSVKSEEKKSFYKKTVFALSETDRCRLGSLMASPESPPPFIPPVYLVNLPKLCSETNELPSKDILKDRIAYHSLMANLDPVSDSIVDFVYVALEVFYFDKL